MEAPSQMLEHWCWEPGVLAGFSRHFETGEPLPASLVESMVAAKNLSSGVMTLRQLFFATLDLTYHSPGFAGDTTETLRELHGITAFPYTEGTHFQSGFGHLFGYDAGYYGYLWSGARLPRARAEQRGIPAGAGAGDGVRCARGTIALVALGGRAAASGKPRGDG